jgi:hypothetical protein
MEDETQAKSLCHHCQTTIVEYVLHIT